jgi:DNA polymerase-3 subunit delta
VAALKGAAIEAYLARPDAAFPVALVFGPDTGLVSERVRALIQKSVDDLSDPFSLVRLDGDELAADPARLVDEASTIPLFGGRRGIWVKAGSRDFGVALAALLELPLRDCRVVIEAGDLKRSAPLRTVCERHPKAAAIPCYPDGERDLGRVIDEEMRAAGLTISPEARTVLMGLLGEDRLASLSEVRKLAIYASGSARVELDDVMAVIADAASLAVDGIIDAAFAGHPDEVEAQLARAQSAGIPATRILAIAQGHAGQLHRARLAVESGAPVADAAGVVLTIAQFRRRATVESALKRWNSPRLERAMLQLAEIAAEARRATGPAAALSAPAIGRALLTIAMTAQGLK